MKSLGDFPLDPDRGLAWLWTGDGSRLLWISPDAAQDLRLAPGAPLESVGHNQSLESFAIELRNLQPDRQPIRVKQVPLSVGRRSELYTCLCRHVPLADESGFGLLTVAIGAPPRLPMAPSKPADVSEGRSGASQEPQAAASDPAAEVEAESDADDGAETVPSAAPPAPEAPLEPAPAAPAVIDLRRSEAAPPASAMPDPPPRPTAEEPRKPNWLFLPAAERRPYRFVWRTDADGRFVQLSRELADAVGPDSAMVLGRGFAEVALDLGVTEAESASAAFAARDTWTAAPALWPVAGTDWGVPVELAGMPVREDGRFAGFRGYGIARVERAVRRPGSASRALAGDAPPPVERAEDRFGPAIALRLASGPAVRGDAAPPPAAPPPAHRESDRPPAAEAPTAAPEAPPRQAAEDAGADESGLSPSERNAFREIAKALGREQPPPAPAADDRPPASPRQMPAWIARRQQARQEAAGDPREVQATVVPLETLRPRLERRSGDAAAAELLGRLPLAVMVMQAGKPVYANAAFLELTGHKDFAAFLQNGGADAFFTGYTPEVGHRVASAITIRDRRGGDIVVEAAVHAAPWGDAPASLISFRPAAPPPRPAGDEAQSRGLELELLAAKAELRELRFVLDTATDGVLSLDSTGRILAVNRSAEALFGFDQNEIVGEPLTILLEPESHPAALDYLEGLKSDGVATIMNDGREVFGRERHGGRIPLFMTLGRMGGPKDATRFCAVLRDVTIWKKAEAELTDARRAAEDSNANKTDFLARVSHEIRTPMNAIIGFAEVMQNETFGPLGHEKYRGYIKDIHASGQHVVSLVNDLLDLSKVAAGKLDLTFGSVDLNQAVAACVSMIQPQANAGKLIVRMQLAQTLPPVVADERSVRQIVLNLLSNAAKFTEPGGQVIVTTALTEKGEAAIRVRDTGIGMSPEELTRALEPFRQIPGPKSSGGTGLGLPLTKALAEANRAAFVIGSEPGKGTLAEVVFPPSRVLAE